MRTTPFPAILFSLLCLFACSCSTTNSSGTLFTDAVRAYRNHKPDEALSLLTQCIMKDSSEYMYYVVRGEILLDKKKHKEALADIDRALVLVPQNTTPGKNTLPFLHLDKALCLAGMGDKRGAITECTKSYALDPSNVSALLTRGAMKCDLNDYAGAIEDCNLYLQSKPDDPFVLNNLGFAEAKAGKGKIALEHLDRSIILAPEQTEFYNNRGQARYDAHDLDGAYSDFSFVITKASFHAEAPYRRATIRFDRKDYDGAIEDCTKAITNAPIYPDAYLLRAKAKKFKGDSAGACADTKKAKEQGSTQADLLMQEHCH